MLVTPPQKFSFKVMLCLLPFPFPYLHTGIRDMEMHFPHSNIELLFQAAQTYTTNT